MSIESPKQLEGMQNVSEVAKAARNLLSAAAVAGASPFELDFLCGEVYKYHGAASAPRLFYGAAVDAFVSVNDAVVHGMPTRRSLRDGDVVKINVTPILNGYVADTATTVVVGRPTSSASKLIECAAAALSAGLAVARAGIRVREIGRQIEMIATSMGFTVIRSLSGHGVGRAIHEEPTVPNYYEKRLTTRMKPGVVLAIEPMISLGSGEVKQDSDGWTIRTVDRSLTAHVEHTIVVTDDAPIVLTA